MTFISPTVAGARLDVRGRPDEPARAYRAWCLDCDYEVELDEDEAERWADRGVPWRTGTE